MDIHRLLNSPDRPRILPSIPPTPRTPSIRRCAPATTRSDRIRIRTALDWATPHAIEKKYGYTIQQIHTARDNPITPQKKRCGRKPKISHDKAEELEEWLLASPSHRHVSFHHLAAFAPELGLQGYGSEAIRTASTSLGYGRRVAKRKGFSSDPAVMAYRLAFATEGLTWTRERLYRQVFSDEVWAHGGAFT